MRSCDTCKSPYVKDIDDMILAGWKIKEIYRWLKGKYADDPNTPSYDSLRAHAEKHVEGVIDRAVKSSKARQTMIRKEIKSSIQSAGQLRQNLEMLSQAIAQIWTQWDPNRYDPIVGKNLIFLINSANRTIELLLKFNQEIQSEHMTEDDLYDRLIYCMHDLPPEIIEKVSTRWEEYVPK